MRADIENACNLKIVWMGTSNQSILAPDFISHLRGYWCSVEQVESSEQAACMLRAVQEHRASYLCAESLLRVKRKQVVCAACCSRVESKRVGADSSLRVESRLPVC